jgi:tRNA-2-methylthio-N6-dimethylallyladenosine synthase
LFSYRERPGTLAARRYTDDVPEEIKKRRLQEIIEVQNNCSKESNAGDVGNSYEVLIEGNSKKSADNWCGRNSQNKMVVFPKNNQDLKKGDYVMVKIERVTQATLIGTISAE